MPKTPRCILLLQSAIKTEATLNSYIYNLHRFRKFWKIKDFDSLLKIEPKKINEMIEDWLMHLRKNVSPNSVPTMYYGVELFFSMNDVTINSKKLRRMFPAKVKRSGDKPYTTEHIRAMLEATRYKRDKAIILFLSSSGARIGSFEKLCLSNIVDLSDNCKAVWIYEGDKEEYWTFLTPEAAKALDEYLKERKDNGERLTPDSPVFQTISPRGELGTRPMAITSVRCVVYRALSYAKIKRKKMNYGYDIQVDMGFRKRFNTIMKLNNDVNSNVAEKLMGHKRGLDGVYLSPTREDCFKEFKKSMYELMINDSWRLKKEVEKQNEQLDKMQSEKDNRILELENRLTNTEKFLIEIKNRLS